MFSVATIVSVPTRNFHSHLPQRSSRLEMPKNLEKKNLIFDA
jgi:hypothetical protein